MKFFRIITIVTLLVTLGLSQQVSAQSIFDIESEKSQSGDADMDENYVLSKADIKRASSVDKGLRTKLKIAKSAKKFDGPIIVKKKGVCVKISCSQEDCDSCTLLWSDRNKDGNVNPKSELRCVCQKTRKLCGIMGKRIKCKKR